MANVKHLEILNEGVPTWNAWRLRQRATTLHLEDTPRPNLGGVDLRGRDLRGANLERTILYKADLRGAIFDHKSDFTNADLQWADLRNVDLTLVNLDGADLQHANLSDAVLAAACLPRVQLADAILLHADLMSADLESADLRRADLRGSHLENADLSFALLIGTRFQGAILDGCRVYGASVWNLEVDEATSQRGLIITPRPSLLPPAQAEALRQAVAQIASDCPESRSPGKRTEETSVDEPTVTVDDVAVAQFLYMLRQNQRLQSVIDAVSAKIVLILGNFGLEQKVVLDAIREELKALDYVPVIFDFRVPGSRDTDETINLLARMARFVIADATRARSLPQELKGIVESLPSVPVQPIILATEYEYGMFDHMKRYPWVLKMFKYRDLQHLLSSLHQRIIDPAERRAQKTRRAVAQGLIRIKRNTAA